MFKEFNIVYDKKQAEAGCSSWNRDFEAVPVIESIEICEVEE